MRIQRFFPALFIFFLCSAIRPALAVDAIEVQALMPGMAVVMIDGQRRTIKVGKISPEGVKLIEADSKQATLEIEGKSKSYTLGSSVSLSFTQVPMLEERVFADDRGMFTTIGNINGQTVKFLVDTGATTIAMNKSQAKRLGIRHRLSGKPVTISTAANFVKGYRIILKTVSLGKIKRHNVEAMVVDGKHPGPILLGMSFLDNLKVEKSGNSMTLKQKK